MLTTLEQLLYIPSLQTFGMSLQESKNALAYRLWRFACGRGLACLLAAWSLSLPLAQQV